MNIRWRVELSQDEREELTALLKSGRHAVRKVKRAQILLAADDGVGDGEVAARVGAGGSTVYRTKRRFVEGNLELALVEAPRPGAQRKLSGKEEALLIATACSAPPAGRARWTLELLADVMVALTEHEGLSRETVRRRLAENALKPWRRDMWCVPKVDAAYVAAMEDVLDLYGEPPDPTRPVICFDESPTQLIGEVRAPIPAEPGRLERFDFEYKRNGTVNLFIFLDVNRPLAQGQGHRATCRRRLLPMHARAQRRPFPRSRKDPGRHGQPLDPQPGLPLQRPARTRGQAHPPPPGVPLHPQARQLAQHGGDRDRRPARPMPRPQDLQSRHPRSRDRRLGATAQRQRRAHQMDVHDGESQTQTESRLSEAPSTNRRSAQRVITSVSNH